MTPTIPVRYGIDMLLEGWLEELTSARVGLVTNDAATTSIAGSSTLTPSRLALQQAGVNLVRLFSPEHGLGAVAAGDAVADGVDPLTGVSVVSLYGERLRPQAADLEGLDLLLFDIPDVGARFYTYIWTLSYIMEACAEANLPLWVLDRPNPVGGSLDDVEGPMLDPDISTFVGRWNLPIRHCLTLGELAHLWQQERQLALSLSVIKMDGWQRSMHWPQTQNPFVPMSPALPTYETAILYPGTCLIEGTNLSEGRGTSMPFLQIGAPWVDQMALYQRFQARNLPGLAVRPCQFVPTSSKHTGEVCHGLMLHPITPQQIKPVLTGLCLLQDIIHLHPEHFAWLAYPAGQNEPGFGHFDRLIGQFNLREQLTQADFSPAQVTQVPDWAKYVQPYLLY